MPYYCFKCQKCDVVTERFFTIAECPESVPCDGCNEPATRSIVDEQRGAASGPKGSIYQVSEAAGVGPSQVAEAVEHSKRIGIPTAFTPDGRAIFESRQHRKRYCEAIGLYDRNGGYGDPRRLKRQVEEE